MTPTDDVFMAIWGDRPREPSPQNVAASIPMQDDNLRTASGFIVCCLECPTAGTSSPSCCRHDQFLPKPAPVGPPQRTSIWRRLRWWTRHDNQH